MKYVIYMDVFFVINFFMDLLILVIAGKFIKPQTTTKRCFFAALAGATLTCISVIWQLPWAVLQKIFTYGVISLIMALIGYGMKSVTACMRNLGVIYAVTFSLAGAVNGLYYFTDVGFYIKNLLSLKYLRGINIVTFICITGVGYFITDFFGKYIKNRANINKKGDDIYKATLIYREKRIGIRALYDSGNSLMEPMEGTPVHIAQYSEIKELLEGVEAKDAKIRMVPYKAIGTSMGVLKAIEIDMVQIENQGENIEISKALIGIYEGQLSTTGNYQMILNRSIKKWL